MKTQNYLTAQTEGYKKLKQLIEWGYFYSARALFQRMIEEKNRKNL